MKFENLSEDEIENIINENMNAVYSLLKKYNVQFNSVDYDDLVQEGRIAIYQSLQNFNSNKGVQFSTYMFTIIKNTIVKYLENKNKDNRISYVYLNQSINSFSDKRYKDTYEDIISEDDSIIDCYGHNIDVKSEIDIFNKTNFNDKELLIDKYINQMTILDMSKKYNKKPNTICMGITRALKRYAKIRNDLKWKNFNKNC